MKCFLLIFAAILVLAACSGGGTSCTKVAVDGGGHIACTGSLDQLTGKQEIDFDLQDIGIGGSISAKINITVGKGTLKITYLDGAGKSMTYIVSPAKPLALIDELHASSNQAEITFDSEAATASGIHYTAEFTE
ncbi:MAG TPA: hypothetical protein VHD90_00160 [Phototrophicaceae bacterium]|nr:hypothetical protein [Phototrophicaceae bacterium]